MKTNIDFIPNIIDTFNLYANPIEASNMKGYMKDKFDFFGIKSPKRKEIISPYYKEFKALNPGNQKNTINYLWSKPERECQYTAMDFASKIEKKMDQSWLSFWIEKITDKSWWDTVDFIATHCIGPLLLNNNESEKLAWQWTENTNIWLQRTAIIYQLKYKSQTNARLLFDIISAQASNKEFFIKKASGWALREYSKTNPLAVSQFINQNRDILSTLTIKEGEKIMKKF